MREKFSRRGVGVAALELVLVGESDGVDEEIDERPMRAFERGERRIDGGDVLDVAGQHELRAERFRPAA